VFLTSEVYLFCFLFRHGDERQRKQVRRRNSELRNEETIMSCCEDTKVAKGPLEPDRTTERPEIADYHVTMLIAAGAAMAANCEPCLNKVVPSLIEAGVSLADIRSAVSIGQAVKDRPAAIMKEAADVLTGTKLSEESATEGCLLEEMKQKQESVAA
jgi:hypothetical protein